jgi:hypothetical protein
VAPFIRAPRFDQLVAAQPTRLYLATLRRVLDGVRELVCHSQATCPDLKRDDTPLDLPVAARTLLDYVASHAALDHDLIEALEKALTLAGTTPSRPQHGDLWAQNVLIDRAVLWVIDLEHYGTVSCPLYDGFTLLTSTIRLRRSGDRGIKGLLGSDREALACRQLLAAQAAADGVDVAKLDGLLVYYVIHRASTVSMRAGQLHGRPHFDDVRSIAQFLASGRCVFPARRA